MKKWFRFFFLSFFSNKLSKEGEKRGYTNLFLGLLLSFAFLWMGVFGGEMLPFATHYNHATDLVSTVHTVLASPDATHRIDLTLKDGVLAASKQGGTDDAGLIVSTLKNEEDRERYAGQGYDVVIDTRPADTLAEVEAYCVSNDGKGTEITYEEYLTLSEVARLNFVFHLRYTGEALTLTDTLTDTHKAYLLSLGDEKKGEVEKLDGQLADGTLTQEGYRRALYQLYFTNYYPSITEYEETSRVPLLRNYYYHEYIKDGKTKYLFLFDDYLAGSFETDNGMLRTFYGYYNNMEDGALIREGMDEEAMGKAADTFIKDAFSAMAPLTAYAHAMNIFTFIPFIALMPLVVALLAHSLLRLRGVDSIRTLGGMVKTVGSYIWFSGVISAVLTLGLSFLVQPRLISALPLVLFFVALMVRSILLVVEEWRVHKRQLEQTTTQTEA